MSHSYLTILTPKDLRMLPKFVLERLHKLEK